LPAETKALLLIDIDGLKKSLADASEKIIHAATNAGLIAITAAANAEEAEKLWQARKALSPALRTIAPQKINEDVVVPVSALPDLITGLEQLAEHYQITIVNFGHAGNGNIHVNLLTDAKHPTQRLQAEKCLSAIFDLVLKLRGTLSGEHGVGLEKRDFITREIAPANLHLMRQIKTVFDPDNILNPGKIWPEPF
jgi:D-lactate dehydrogenase